MLNHVSGRLKVAPEHTADHVVNLMRKVPFSLFMKLKKEFDNLIAENSLNYQLVPYFISSHPGCTEKDMADLAQTMQHLGLNPEQVQDFTPTPMTLSTVIYYTGYDPYTGKKVFVERTIDGKRRQKSYFFKNRSERK